MHRWISFLFLILSLCCLTGVLFFRFVRPPKTYTFTPKTYTFTGIGLCSISTPTQEHAIYPPPSNALPSFYTYCYLI